MPIARDLLIETMNSSVVVIDINRSALALLGLEGTDMLGRDISEIQSLSTFHDDSKEIYKTEHAFEQGEENPNAVVVYYIDDSGELQAIQGAYNEETGSVDFTAYHFSVYAIGYNMTYFTDVEEKAWCYDAVTFCAARGITAGIGNDLFGPENIATRGQFIVMLMHAYGIKADEYVSENFSDVREINAWSADAMMLLVETGTISGSNGKLIPTNTTTRVELAQVLHNLFAK